MPRAFLITHRRYNGAEAEFDGSRGDYSPERGVRLAEYGAVHPTSDGASECGSETSSECPEELYNLTKLAEVSLAAAAGTLIHPSNIVYQRSASPRCTDLLDKCTVKNTNSRAKQHPPQQHQGTFQYEHQYQQQHQQEQQHEEPIHSQEPLRTGDYEEERKILGERTRLFFERIESEREILELQTERNAVLEVRLSSPQHHRHHHRHYHSQHHHHHHPHHLPAVVAVAPHRLQHQQENKEEEKEKRDAIARVQLPPDNNRVAEAIKAEQSSTTSTTRIVAVSPLPPQPPLPPKAVQQHATTESTKTTTEDNEDHECPDCGKKYSTSSNLARHRQTHRSLGDKKARRCPHCDKLYVSMPAFSMHVRTHNQGCKCHYCGKCFSRPWLLQGHIRTHTGEKPFKCTICNKAFADKSNLRAHIQTHSNTKPHVCGRCGKAFALKSYLYKHEESSCMRAHHRSSTTEKNESTEGQKTKAKGNSSSSSSTINSTQSITTTTTTSTTLTTARVTASPTSVIVPRLGLDRDRNSSSAFSAIIRHTGASDASSVHPPSKRPCKEPTTTTTTTKTTTTTEAATTSMASSSQDRERRKTEECPRDSEIVSNMVIRTSVISPNPERLGRFCNDIAKKPTSNFDYNDATRTSDFSRPTTMTLNLAIA